MPVLNARKTKVAKHFCIKRDGEKCNGCKKTKKYMVLDHIDNDRKNNPTDGSNWQILCRSCNTKKNPRGVGRRGLRALGHKKHSLYIYTYMYRKKNSPERDRAFENIETVATTEQMKRNKDCEPKFREWILEVLKHIGMIEFREAVNSGAEHAGCSQNTIVRYLDKMCSYAGECEYYLDEKGKKFIRLKEHFRVKHNGVKSRSDNP